MPENYHIYELARSVESEADFLHFARALLADWQDEEEQIKLRPPRTWGDRGLSGWENGTMEAFLDAMIAWCMDSHHDGLPNDPPSWNLFAVMLLMGSRYE